MYAKLDMDSASWKFADMATTASPFELPPCSAIFLAHSTDVSQLHSPYTRPWTWQPAPASWPSRLSLIHIYELAKYQEKAKLGSLGFFQEVGSTYAASLLQRCV